MDQEQIAKKPQKGAWGRIGQQSSNKVTFDINIPQTVEFLTSEPQEVDGDEGVYYIFPVRLLDGTESKVQTSAWTLLGSLKKLEPLQGKLVQITKKLDKGKQNFIAQEVPRINKV